jgi:hypothetical protein
MVDRFPQRTCCAKNLPRFKDVKNKNTNFPTIKEYILLKGCWEYKLPNMSFTYDSE